MAWRDDLRRVTLPDGRVLVGASFRGVPFLVDSHERGGGRRAVVHEFPFRDDPFVEDLGRKARTFRIDGYVIGDDYLSQRDDLLAALEDTEGPGELVHPYHGVRRAICLSVSVREAKAEGAMATFALEFAETPTQAPVPTEVVDNAEQVDASADAALEATSAELVEKYDADDLPSFALESAIDAIKGAAATLQEKLGPITSVTQELSTLTSQVTLLTAQASSLARTPANVVDGFADAFVGLAETMAASPKKVMDALIAAYDVDLGNEPEATTATRAQEATNQAALTGALRRIFAIQAARLAPLVPYESIEDATAARDAIAGMLDEQLQTAGDTAYPALVDLRADVTRAVPGGNAFARVVTVTRNVAIPSLLLAYQLYGSVDAELDLVARNKVRHPGFVAGDLKALSDV